MQKIILVIVLLVVLLTLAFHFKVVKSENKITSITMQEAKEKLKVESSYTLLDVRTEEEYKEGHIKGAVNLSHEKIASEAESILKDKEQKIFVYCRSGNRSKIAAESLLKLGYKNVIEIGGIIDWTGEIEK